MIPTKGLKKTNKLFHGKYVTTVNERKESVSLKITRNGIWEASEDKNGRGMWYNHNLKNKRKSLKT